MENNLAVAVTCTYPFVDGDFDGTISDTIYVVYGKIGLSIVFEIIDLISFHKFSLNM